MADGFSVILDGWDAFQAAMEKIGKEADAASREIVVKGAAIIEAKAKANFEGSRKRVRGPRGGRAYDPPQHVGGDKPNVITGTLRRSIRHAPVTRYGLGDYGTAVFPRAVYARRVELGYRGSKGYPYFTPAYDDAKPELDALARATWARALHHF